MNKTAFKTNNMKIQNYINGEFVNPIQDDWLENYNPAIGEVYGQTPNSSIEDVEKAYQAAATAFLSWRQTTVVERSEILIKIANLILDKIHLSNKISL